MKTIRALIIDDERLAREELRRMLRDFPQMAVIAEAGNVADAELAVRQHRPDLLFLDIQLPGATGFELLERLTTAPEVVFVTAYDQYALDAFEVNALDYLMKPIRAERLAQLIGKVVEKFARAKDQRALFVKDGNKCHWISQREIWLIESVENYARIRFGDKIAYIRRSLNQLEEQLAGEGFFRANRAQLVNTGLIARVSQAADGRLGLEMTNGEIVHLSERAAVKFKSMNKL
jgi:two-component system LytT family response regulator